MNTFPIPRDEINDADILVRSDRPPKKHEIPRMLKWYREHQDHVSYPLKNTAIIIDAVSVNGTLEPMSFTPAYTACLSALNSQLNTR